MDLLTLRSEIYRHAEGEILRQKLYQLPQQPVVSVGCLDEYLRLAESADTSSGFAQSLTPLPVIVGKVAVECEGLAAEA